MKPTRCLWTLILPCLTILSCAPSVYREVYPTLLDGRYDSEFPYRACSKQLEEIAKSVKRLTVMANYSVYTFRRTDSVQLGDITPSFLESRRELRSAENRSSEGTATVLYNDEGRIVILTCAHVVNYPEKSFTYFSDADQKPTQFIKSYAVKSNQLNFLSEMPGGVALEILALDKDLDIALLGQKLDPARILGLRPFMYPFGKAKELEWGTFVYVFGYPSGYKMITKGIVSSPNSGKQGSFVVDAVISPGSSGSVAFAIRDGVPNFELVGIVRLIPAHASYLLIPSGKTGTVEYDLTEPYHGDVFVDQKIEIQYGIAQAISSESILDFIQQNELKLAAKGYRLRPLKKDS